MEENMATHLEMNPELADQLLKELDNMEVEETDKFVMKELLRSKGEDIRFKTDLRDKQINAITKMLIADGIIYDHDRLAKNEEPVKLKSSIIESMTNTYMQIVVSRQRKGRLEFIDAWKGSFKEKFGGLFNRFNNQQP